MIEPFASVLKGRTADLEVTHFSSKRKLLFVMPGACDFVFTFEPGGEFHHLLGLDVLQSINASDAVADRQNTTGLLEICLARLTEDALLKNRRNLREKTLLAGPIHSLRTVRPNRHESKREHSFSL